MPAKVEEEAQPIAHPVAEEAKVHSVNSSKKVSKKRDFAEFSTSEIAEAIGMDSKPSTKKSLRLNDGTRVEVVIQETLEPQPERTETDNSEPRADPAAMATKETETVSNEISPQVEAEEAKGEEEPVPASDAPVVEEVQQITEQVESLIVEDAGAAEKSSGEEEAPADAKPADDEQPAEVKQVADPVEEGGDAQTDPVAAQQEPDQQPDEQQAEVPATSESV